MWRSLITAALAATMALGVAGCASRQTGDTYSRSEVRQPGTVQYGSVVSLRPVTIDIKPLVPGGFMRQMDGEVHRRYRKALVHAVNAADGGRVGPLLEAVIAEALPALVRGVERNTLSRGGLADLVKALGAVVLIAAGGGGTFALVQSGMIGGGEAEKNQVLTATRVLTNYGMIFPLGDPPNYEPAEETSLAHQARREGRSFSRHPAAQPSGSDARKTAASTPRP